jgi:hypothetical protein
VLGVIVDERTVPDELSKRKVTASPVTKFVSDAVVVDGRLVKVVGESDIPGDPTVTATLRGLSLPIQLFFLGVTEYRHDPGARPDSEQLKAETVPEHVPVIVCPTLLPSYRVTR